VIAQRDREKDRALSDIWLVATKGRKRVQLTNRFHRDGSPRWSPDGGRIAFVAPEKDDDKAKPQIWVIPVGGGEAKQITRLKQGASNPVWSPDGKRIAFLARDPKREDDEQDPKKPKIEMKKGRVYATDVKVIDRIRYQSTDFPPKDERRHIYIVSAAGGRPQKLTSGDWDDHSPSWSPDGKQIAFESNRGRDPDWDILWDVWVVSVASGRPRRLSTLEGGASGPVWSPDGKWIAYCGSPVGRHSFFGTQLWAQPARGGPATCLTESLDRLPSGACWAPDGSGLYFHCSDEGFESLWRANLKGEVERVLPEGRYIESYSVARQAGTIAFVNTSPEAPGDVFCCDGAGEGERRLTNENRTALSGLRLGTTESFWCKSFDGTKIQGWMVKPPGFRAGRRYPLVLVTHGGPYWAFFHTWDFDAQVLAARGYVVVYANCRGSLGYGKSFMKSVVGNWGVEDSRDYLAAMDHVIRKGGVDRKRLGVTGGSYGGFMTTWLLGTTDRFAAGVAQCAATDEPMFYYSADMPLWSEEEAGGPPWERLDDYRRLSSSTHSHKIKAPLLLLHAEDDTRVPISHSEIVYTTAKRIGVEAEFVRYPSGGHGFSSSAPRFICDALNRMGDWFDRHLKGSSRRR
jgi:dipeptidyl aminopeptidase/acylaminoacyl peptidase